MTPQQRRQKEAAQPRLAYTIEEVDQLRSQLSEARQEVQRLRKVTKRGGAAPEVVDVTQLKSEPEVVDEITSDRCSVHVERMSDGHYWMRIGDRVFDASTLKRGKLVIIERVGDDAP